MPPPDETAVEVEVIPAEITGHELLEEFLALQHEWGFRAFRHPGSTDVCGGVELPGPEELVRRAEEARIWVGALRTGRI